MAAGDDRAAISRRGEAILAADQLRREEARG
jgi:hypothetical protein